MSEKIDLRGLPKAAVLAALFNASKPQGMGFMHYNPTPMTVEQAAEFLKQSTYFDYLQGRVMKIDLSGDALDPWGYDRDNGEGAAQKALASLQATLNPANSEILQTHAKNTRESAEFLQSHLNEETRIEENGNVVTVNLGVGDMKYFLSPKLDKVLKKDKDQ